MEGIVQPASPERQHRVTVLEQIPLPLVGKGEDRFLVDPERCIAVFDGVTSHSKARLELDGVLMTYGQFAAEIGKRALTEAAQIECPDEEFPHRVAAHVADELFFALLRQEQSGIELTELPSFVFAAYFPQRRMLVRVGDCSVLADGQPLPGFPNQELTAEVRKTQMRSWLATRFRRQFPDASDESVKSRASAIGRLWQWRHRNRAHGSSARYGYGAVSGEVIPDAWVESQKIDAREIVLSTDGVPRAALRGNWADTERALRELGTKGIKPDDITYLRARVE